MKSQSLRLLCVGALLLIAITSSVIALHYSNSNARMKIVIAESHLDHLRDDYRMWGSLPDDADRSKVSLSESITKKLVMLHVLSFETEDINTPKLEILCLLHRDPQPYNAHIHHDLSEISAQFLAQVNREIMRQIATPTACIEQSSFDKGRFVNHSDDPKHQQMVAALQSLPPEVALEEYRHFHITDETGNQQRMVTNLHSSLTRKDTRVVSISCDGKIVCERVVVPSLHLVSEETPLRDDLSLILPSYMDPPYSLASKAGVVITLYETPSLGANSK